MAKWRRPYPRYHKAVVGDCDLECRPSQVKDGWWQWEVRRLGCVSVGERIAGGVADKLWKDKKAAETAAG